MCAVFLLFEFRGIINFAINMQLHGIITVFLSVAAVHGAPTRSTILPTNVPTNGVSPSHMTTNGVFMHSDRVTMTTNAAAMTTNRMSPTFRTTKGIFASVMSTKMFIPSLMTTKMVFPSSRNTNKLFPTVSPYPITTDGFPYAVSIRSVSANNGGKEAGELRNTASSQGK